MSVQRHDYTLLPGVLTEPQGSKEGEAGHEGQDRSQRLGLGRGSPKQEHRVQGSFRMWQKVVDITDCRLQRTSL